MSATITLALLVPVLGASPAGSSVPTAGTSAKLLGVSVRLVSRWGKRDWLWDEGR